MAQQVIVNGKPHPRLYWRGRTIWYQGPDPNGSGKNLRLSTGCKDPSAAALKAKEYESSAASPSYRASYESSLAWAIRTWIELARSAGNVEVTIKRKESLLGHFATMWGEDLPLARINAAKVTSYWLERQEHYVDNACTRKISKKTVGIEIGELRAMLAHCAFIGAFSTPLEQVFPKGKGAKAFKGERTDHSGEFPTRDEVALLLAELEPHRAAHVAYALATSCRMSETFRARRSDVVKTEKGRTVLIHGRKTRHAREVATTIPVIEQLVGGLLDFALEHAPGEDSLFAEWASGNSHKDLARACVAAGIPPYTWNDFRRAAPNWLLEDGVGSEELAAKLLRHVGLGQVKDYTRRMLANPERIRKLAMVQLGAAQDRGFQLVAPQLPIPGVSAANQLEGSCTGSVQGSSERDGTQETQETRLVANYDGVPVISGRMGSLKVVTSSLWFAHAYRVDITPVFGTWANLSVPYLYGGAPNAEA